MSAEFQVKRGQRRIWISQARGDFIGRGFGRSTLGFWRIACRIGLAVEHDLTVGTGNGYHDLLAAEIIGGAVCIGLVGALFDFEAFDFAFHADAHLIIALDFPGAREGIAPGTQFAGTVGVIGRLGFDAVL